MSKWQGRVERAARKQCMKCKHPGMCPLDHTHDEFIAGAKFERARARKLVEALKDIAEERCSGSDDGEKCNCLSREDCAELARTAIAEYEGER